MATAYTDQVQKVYIAYYGRAADPVGLAYWAGKVETDGLAGIMASFGASAEATTLYGSLTNTAKVNALFQQSFGRDADFAGLMYYAGQLTAGTMTAATIAQNIFDGASGNDATILANKLVVAKAYTAAVDTASEVVAYSGTVAAAAARALLTTVDAATVTASFDVATSVASIVTTAAATPANVGTTFTLTTAADTGGKFVGAAGNDTFVGVVGTVSTLSSGDYMQGGTGADSLDVSLTGTGGQTVAGVVATGVETINMNNYTTAGNETINTAQMTGLTDLNLSGSSATGDTFFTNVGNIVNSKMANGLGDLNITYTDAAVVGTTDTATLTLANQTGGAYILDAASAGSGIETLSVVSGTSKNTVNITDNKNILKTVNLSGDQALVTTIASTGLRTVSAAEATGKMTVTTNVTGDMVITGGAGADKITFTGTTWTLNDTVNGGAGEDVLEIGTAITAATGLKNVSNVETVKMSGTAAVTLAKDANVMSFDLSGTGINVLTLNTGVLAATTVKLGITGADQAINSANVVMTVNGAADAIDTAAAITGGTAADTINITADTNSDAAIALAGAITNVETINVLDGGDAAVGAAKLASGSDVSITTGAYATALTIDASALNAAISDDNADGKISNTDSSAEILTVDGTGATKALNITGGAAGDTITGGNAADTIKGGAGDDTITMGAKLTAADTIDGGDGADTLNVTTVSAAALAGVTNVETLAVTGTSTVSLNANLAFATIDVSAAAVQTLSFTKGYTTATTVALKKAVSTDVVTNTADLAMTVDATSASAITAAMTITGDATTTNDAIIMSAGAPASAVTGDDGVAVFTNVTNVDSVTIRKGADAGDDVDLDLGSYATKLTIDASAMNAASSTNAAGTAILSDATDAFLTLTATNATKDLIVTGSSGWDIISAGQGNDSYTLGLGNDSLTFASGKLSNLDTVSGGDGTDTVSVDSTIAVTDVNFINMTSVENLTVVTDVTADVTLSTYASAAGITKVTVVAGAGNDVVNAAGMTTGINIVGSTATTGNDTLTGGLGDDTFTFSTTAGLETADTLDGGAGIDTVSLDNSGGAFTATSIVVDDVAAASKVVKVEKFVVLNANGGDTVGSEDADAVQLTFGNTAAAAALSTIVDGSVITDTNDVLTVNASAVVDAGFFTTFDIRGGAAADSLLGGNGADTITGGGGVDAIDAGVGADTLTGGAGADQYTLVTGDSTSSKSDTITDFAAASDKLNITVAGNITWDLTDKGDVASSNAGAALLSAALTGGEYFFNTATSSFVQDTDGNGLIQSGDTVIKLTDETGFASADVNFTVSGSLANNVTTGDGADKITMVGTSANNATNNNVVTAGKGDDTITLATAAGLAATDILSGGAGTDTLVTTDTGLVDADLAGTTGIETLKAAGASSFTLGSNAIISGISKVVTSAAAQTVAIAAAYTALTIDAAILANDIDLTLTETAAGGITVTGLFGDIAATLDDASSTLDVALVKNAGDSDITLAMGSSIATTTVTGGVAGDTVTVTSAAAMTIDVSSGGASEFVITGGAGAQTILASANGDIITGGAALDVITLGAGVDTLVTTGDAIGATVDTVASFTGGSDIVQFDKSELDAAFSAIMLAGAADTAIAATIAAGAGVLTIATGAFDAGTVATTTAYVISGTTAFTVATLSDALEASGTHAMISNGAWAIGAEAWLVVYDDNANTYLATVDATTALANDAIMASGGWTIANIMQLTGVADATAFTTADFQLIA